MHRNRDRERYLIRTATRPTPGPLCGDAVKTILHDGELYAANEVEAVCAECGLTIYDYSEYESDEGDFGTDPDTGVLVYYIPECEDCYKKGVWR